MDLFEYILVITSVVYALAMAQVLSGVGRLAQTEATIRPFLPHSLWVVSLFLSILMFWWAGWEFRSVEWTFPKYVYTMITPICMFYSSTLIVPARTNDGEVDLERHFSKVRKPVIWSFLIALLTQFADGPILADEPLWFTGRLLQAVLLSAVILGALAKSKRLQALSPTGLLLFLAFVSITRLWTPGVNE